MASYVLYLIYTTAAIVYDTLPEVLPGVRPYRPLLEVLLPVMLAVVMLAGRTVTLVVIGLLAAGQMILLAVLAAVTIGHDAPVSAFGAQAPTRAIVSATAQTALLFVCGSLPLFLGGELARPTRTVRRGLVTVARVFSGHALALAVGLGVAASVAGVMLVELLALSRLVPVITGRSTGSAVAVLTIVLVAAGPVSLVNPEAFYEGLLKPSLIALWLSQLVVFVVYPRFAARQGWNRALNGALALGGSAFAAYGIYATIQHASS